ncbi:hypothetical protein [Solibacillus cecembensis]|uniref:hypothetical protein n=1 Tax=Solibacillus cecembensis TaxID=459347 RepID=UPI003D059143
MRYVLQCEKCERPAPVISKKHGHTIVGHETVKKTVPNRCACGGNIKPMID